MRTLSEMVERDAIPESTPPAGSSSIPVGPEAEPEPGQEQTETAAAIGAFSGFFSGIATAVEQRVHTHTHTHMILHNKYQMKSTCQCITLAQILLYISFLHSAPRGALPPTVSSAISN